MSIYTNKVKEAIKEVGENVREVSHYIYRTYGNNISLMKIKDVISEIKEEEKKEVSPELKEEKENSSYASRHCCVCLNTYGTLEKVEKGKFSGWSIHSWCKRQLPELETKEQFNPDTQYEEEKTEVSPELAADLAMRERREKLYNNHPHIHMVVRATNELMEENSCPLSQLSMEWIEERIYRNFLSRVSTGEISDIIQKLEEENKKALEEGMLEAMEANESYYLQ